MSERGFQFDIVIVGAGPAGMAAACAASKGGQKVALVDETPWLGGQIWRGESRKPTHPQALRWMEKFRQSGATLLDGTSVIASPDRGVFLAEHFSGPREIRWDKCILATGARELFLPFPGWTLPGVVGPGGLLALAKNGWPVRNKRIVIAGSGPLLLAAADGLKKLGARVVSINEQAPRSSVVGFAARLWPFPDKIFQAAAMQCRLLGTPYRCGTWPLKAEGEGEVRQVGLSDGRTTWTEECDGFACGFGLVPNAELPLALGCELQGGFVHVSEWQETSIRGVYCAGEPVGIGGADCALTEGEIAGYAASGQKSAAEDLFVRREKWHRFRTLLAEAFALRRELKTLASEETLLCRCEDVTISRVRQYRGWREAKLQTRCGMGPCQGRVCGAAAKVILGWGMESVRPPIIPATVKSLVSPAYQPHADNPT